MTKWAKAEEGKRKGTSPRHQKTAHTREEASRGEERTKEGRKKADGTWGEKE